MSSVMMRSFADHIGANWPKEWASMVNGKPVTWAQVMAERRATQARRMDHIYSAREEVRAVRVSVRYFDQWCYGGWHAYIDSLALRDPLWVRAYSTSVAFGTPRLLMNAFPIAEKYGDWLPAFAARYRRDDHDGHPRGVVNCWARFHLGHIEEIVPIRSVS